MGESRFPPAGVECDEALDRLAALSEEANGYGRQEREPATEALFAEDISGGK
jgi:hypothetical protein